MVGRIVGPEAGGAVVAAARRQGRLIERINRGAVLCQNRDMHRLVQSTLAADPKIRLAVSAEACGGVVAGRVSRPTDHGGGLGTTFEPVVTELAVGDTVARAALVGRVSAGGHATPGTVHFGVRFQSDYVNPLRLLGGVPRAVLLPCC